MKRRQILVNVLLILLLAGLGWFCWRGGKSYSLLLENLPYGEDGTAQPALEAVNVTIGNGKAIFMLDGDRTATKVMGTSHMLRIDILDEEDRVVETKEIPFSMDELGDPATLNVARAFREGAAAPPS